MRWIEKLSCVGLILSVAGAPSGSAADVERDTERLFEGPGEVVASSLPASLEASSLFGDADAWVAVPAPASSLPMLAKPWRDVTLASGMDSTLLEVRVREGESVKAGQVVALQDWRVAKAAVAAARSAASRMAELDSAELEMELASQRVDRLQRAGRAASRGDVQDAELRLAQAHAALRSALEAREQAKRNLELELARLDQYLLRAPFDGTVVEVLAQPGQMLTTGEPVLRVVDTRTLRVEARVSQEDLPGLAGASAFWLRDEAGAAHRATLDFRSPLLDPASETFKVVYAIDNASGALPPGSILLGGGAAEPEALSGVGVGWGEVR